METVMNNHLTYIEEPKLKFAHNQSAEDSRDGLTLFGPYQSVGGSSTIRAGYVGTQVGLEYYHTFVMQMNRPIYTKSLGRPFFPGFKSVFGIDWSPDPSAKIILQEEDLQVALSIPNLKERTYNLVSLYLDAIKRYIDDEEAVIDIWYVVVPNTVLTLCRSKSVSGKPTYSKRRIETFNSGQISFFEEENEDISQYAEMYESDSDFHDQLKARAIFNKITCPIQVMLQSTLQFHNKASGEEYNDDMKAHLAWTHSSSLYYKLGYLPWKLDSIRDGVCYVGLVFKKLQETGRKRGYACSAAQMFLDSGDGVVFRGNIGPWLSSDEKTFHLDRASAKALLSIAIEAYHTKHKGYPKELFIHGRTAFIDSEWRGFQDAIQETPSTNLVGVTIKENSGFRLLRDNSDPKSQYGVLRGLCLYVNEKSGYLWTKGFIPKTETANHMEVARPLQIEISRGQADIATVIRDILSLTKLNYNACIYGDGLPVTLRFSDKIGDILTAIPEVNWAAKPFKYYI